MNYQIVPVSTRAECVAMGGTLYGYDCHLYHVAGNNPAPEPGYHAQLVTPLPPPPVNIVDWFGLGTGDAKQDNTRLAILGTAAFIGVILLLPKRR